MTPTPTTASTQGAEPLIEAERARLSDMILAMMKEAPFRDYAWARMALSCAARNVRRGRPLTASEQRRNIDDAMNAIDDAMEEASDA